MSTETRPIGKRPTMVWVVFLFYVVSAGCAVLSFVPLFSGVLPQSPEVTVYFDNLPAYNWALAALEALLNLAGAIALFRLRKIAFYLFAAAFAVILLQTLAHIVFTHLLAALGGAGVAGGLIGYAILLAVCIYAWKLKARGVLA